MAPWGGGDAAVCNCMAALSAVSSLSCVDCPRRGVARGRGGAKRKIIHVCSLA